MVKYRIKVKANKNEEEVVVEVVEKEEEVVGQEGDNDEQKMKTKYEANGGKEKFSKSNTRWLNIR